MEDLEFVQFHPTAIRLDDAPCLISKPFAVKVRGRMLWGEPCGPPAWRPFTARPGKPSLMQAMQRQQVKQMRLDFAAIPRDQAGAASQQS